MNIEVLPMNFNHVGHKKVYQLSPCAIHQCFHFIISISVASDESEDTSREPPDPDTDELSDMGDSNEVYERSC